MDNEHGKLEWPKKAILELIQMWQTYECLYNPQHRFYHNKNARYAALKQMAEELKVYNPLFGAADIKIKITYLRGQYTREFAKAKERKNGSGAEGVYVPAAYWYNKLSFLNDFLKTRKGGCNLYDENSEQTEDSLDCSLLQDVGISSAQHSKRLRLSSETRQTSREDSRPTPATAVLQNNASSTKKVKVDEKVEAFCNYVKAELNAMTNLTTKDKLMERITEAIFDAKQKQRISKEDENQSAKSNTEILTPTVYYEDISDMNVPACGTLDTMVHLPPHCSTAANNRYEIELIDIKNECESESETESAAQPMSGPIKANDKDNSTTLKTCTAVGDEGTKLKSQLHELPNVTVKNAQELNGLKYAKFETFIASAMEVMQDPEMEKLTELKIRMIVSEMSYKAAKRQLAIFNEANNLKTA